MSIAYAFASMTCVSGYDGLVSITYVFVSMTCVSEYNICVKWHCTCVSEHGIPVCDYSMC